MNRKLFPENERDAWIFLNHIQEIGPMRFHRLLHWAKSAMAILELPVSGLEAAEVPREQAERWWRAFRDPVQGRWLEVELNRLSHGEFQLVTELDEGYPTLLRELLGRPPVLYYKGRWPPPAEGVVGMVGTRHPSPYGRSVAERLAADLAVQGIATISGMALGIDSVVHETSLKAGGYTAAVLGGGLSQDLTRDRQNLMERIAVSGAVLSEFSSDTVPTPGHFPRRNRIISGLSQGVVVIEAGEHSGALITARNAAEQGRDVFAVPGSIFSAGSAGCHRLIRQGARLVETSADILTELGIPTPLPTPPSPAPRCFDTLSPLEKQVVELLASAPLSADELAQATQQRFELLANGLLSLELKGLIRSLPGQRYART
jgi:DNA processing protein